MRFYFLDIIFFTALLTGVISAQDHKKASAEKSQDEMSRGDDGFLDILADDGPFDITAFIENLTMDTNADGKVDIFLFKDPSGELRMIAEDTNYDGLTDVWYNYSDSKNLEFIDKDTNGDLVVDARLLYSHNKLNLVLRDKENRGAFNAFLSYAADTGYVLALTDSNYDGRIDRWEIYQINLRKKRVTFDLPERKIVEAGVYREDWLSLFSVLSDTDDNGQPDYYLELTAGGRTKLKKRLQTAEDVRRRLEPFDEVLRFINR